ncbi:hypothetical protein BG004_006287 [Podila humilis]|nr:hypothetical protein BG004_006287 [Podila humilis]
MSPEIISQSLVPSLSYTSAVIAELLSSHLNAIYPYPDDPAAMCVESLQTKVVKYLSKCAYPHRYRAEKEKYIVLNILFLILIWLENDKFAEPTSKHVFVVLCSWTYEQEVPSFLRQFEKVEKLSGLVLYTREYALQSFQSVDQTGTALLSKVDHLLARASMPMNSLSSPGSDPLTAARTSISGSDHSHLHDGVPHTMNGNVNGNGALSNNRLLFLAGEVKEAIRFWREQCMFSQPMELKMAELDRVVDIRNLALGDVQSTVEEKARALRISSEQSKLLTDAVEPVLQLWAHKVVENERSRGDEHSVYGERSNHDGPPGPGPGPAPGPPHLSLDHRSMSSHSLGSPAAYSSQSWGPGS